MKHLKEYFEHFEANKLKNVFDELRQDNWEVSEENNLVDSFGTEWNFRDVDHFVFFSRSTFNTIVAGYKIFLGLLDGPFKESLLENIQEKLESANSKIKLLEEQNSSLKKELDARRKELYYPVESPKTSTKEYIALKRRKYVKIE